jgi:hypothetical protein
VLACSNALGPRFLGPLVGENNIVRFGLLGFAACMLGMAASPNGGCFAASVLLGSVATMCLPCLTGIIARAAHDDETGAMLTALDQLGTLDRLISYKCMSRLFAFGINHGSPGAHFYLGAGCVVAGWAFFEGALLPGARRR